MRRHFRMFGVTPPAAAAPVLGDALLYWAPDRRVGVPATPVNARRGRANHRRPARRAFAECAMNVRKRGVRCLGTTPLAQSGRPGQRIEARISSVGPLGVERELVGVVEEYGEP